MDEDGYGLGVDIGAGGVSVAACTGTGGEPEAVPVALAAGRTARVMGRVGTPVPLYEAGCGRPAVDIAVDVVDAVRTAAEEQRGRAPAWTVVTVPPSWGAYRTGLLADSLTAALGEATSVVSGALAATYAHLHAGRLADAATVAVHDLGARTLDTAVVRGAPGGELRHVGTPPAPTSWAGEDIDDALLGHVLQALAPAPPPDRARGRALRGAVVAAKEALSTDTTTTLAPPPGTGRPADGLRLTREELDELVGAGIAQSVDALVGTVEDAGLDVAQIDAVVLMGGSARVPLVGECLSAALGRPLVVDPEPELTAARGAALLARGLGSERPGDGGPAPEPPTPLPAPGPGTGRSATRAVVARPPTARHSRPAPRPAGRSTPRRVGVVGGLLLGLLLVPPTLSEARVSVSAPVGEPVAPATLPTPDVAGPAAPAPAPGAVILSPGQPPAEPPAPPEPFQWLGPEPPVVP